ncbi:MAG TPA: O-methyltransferase [Nitrospiria bacterium]|nr:O-methyltransferase [Nitrospiria bacterium]
MVKHPRDPVRTPARAIEPVHPKIFDYLAGLHQRHDEPVLLEMEAEARERGFPIVGRVVGVFIEVMALSVGARTIFEFGSGYGYSAYWFSRAVGPEGSVICTDGKADNARKARTYLERVGRWPRIDFRVGWAQDAFRATEGRFDVIYNDVDKDAYPEVWRLARERVRPGGLYIADNTLWSGRVVQDRVVDDVAPGWTEAIIEHNRLIAHDPDYDCFLNPIRDGVIVARRKT